MHGEGGCGCEGGGGGIMRGLRMEGVSVQCPGQLGSGPCDGGRLVNTGRSPAEVTLGLRRVVHAVHTRWALLVRRRWALRMRLFGGKPAAVQRGAHFVERRLTVLGGRAVMVKWRRRVAGPQRGRNLHVGRQRPLFVGWRGRVAVHGWRWAMLLRRCRRVPVLGRRRAMVLERRRGWAPKGARRRMGAPRQGGGAAAGRWRTCAGGRGRVGGWWWRRRYDGAAVPGGDTTSKPVCVCACVCASGQ